jgi:hypothetical protein
MDRIVTVVLVFVATVTMRPRICSILHRNTTLCVEHGRGPFFFNVPFLFHLFFTQKLNSFIPKKNEIMTPSAPSRLIMTGLIEVVLSMAAAE